MMVSPPADPGRRRLCVVLHDVAPAHWGACIRVLAHLHDLAQHAGVALPLTLLVVPAMHGDPLQPPGYLRWLRRLARNGHELALHGLTHRDEAPAGSGWLDHARRRWYTAGEGEFAALDRPSAAARLALGQRWAAAHHLFMPGFVAPAWLLSRPALTAVAEAGFDYTCTLSRVIALPQLRVLHARSMVFSTRTAMRRALSVVWNPMLAIGQREAPVLRLELHPGDADHAAVRVCWSRWLLRALRERQPLRLGELAALARLAPGASGWATA